MSFCTIIANLYLPRLNKYKVKEWVKSPARHKMAGNHIARTHIRIYHNLKGFKSYKSYICIATVLGEELELELGGALGCCDTT